MDVTVAIKHMSNSDYSRIDVKPLTGAIGAEVSGIYLDKDLDEQTFAEIHRAFLEHLVLVFRNQQLSVNELKSFTRRFGDLHIHPYTEPLPGHPEIVQIVKTENEQHNWGDMWHADLSSFAEPPLGSVIYARQVPQSSGDTQWANMYLAYETLSEAMQALLLKLKCVHNTNTDVYANFEGMGSVSGESSSAEHPLVRIHPETGKRALFVGRRSISHFAGMTAEESAPLLRFLHDHSENPDFAFRLQWKPDTVVVWDNRCTLHRVCADYFHELRGVTPARREMLRLSIVGQRPQ